MPGSKLGGHQFDSGRKDTVFFGHFLGELQVNSNVFSVWCLSFWWHIKLGKKIVVVVMRCVLWW